MSSTDTFKVNGNTLFQSAEDEMMIKINQICELTGCSNDAAATALYDSHYNIEIAIDKILENTQKINNDWYEVAKNKKKPIIESNPIETEIEKEVDEKSTNMIKSGRGRGRSRNVRSNRNNDAKSIKDEGNQDWINSKPMSRGRGGGRRPTYRNSSIRNKSKGKLTDENISSNIGKTENFTDRNVEEKWPGCDDWLCENTKITEVNEVKQDDISNELSYSINGALNLNKFNEYSNEKQQITSDKATTLHQSVETNLSLKVSSNPGNYAKENNQQVPQSSVETVAKSSSKDEIFGDFSRTKPPAPSTFSLLTDPVKLITSNGGVMSSTSKPGFNFTFGFDFKEYSLVKPSGDKVTSKNNFMDSEKSSIRSSKDMNTDNSLGISSALESSNPRIDQIFKTVSATSTATDLKLPEQSNSPSLDNLNQKSMSEHQHNLSTENDDSVGQNLPLNPILSNNASGGSTSIPVVSNTSAGAIFAPPPGMTNQHHSHLATTTAGHLPVSQNAPPYLSLLKIQNGNPIFQHNNIQQQLHHSDLRDNITPPHIQVPTDNENSLENNSPNTTSVSTNTTSTKQKISNNSGQYLGDKSTVTVGNSNQNTPNIISPSGNVKHQQVQLDNGEMERNQQQHSVSTASNGAGNNSILLTQPTQHHISHLPPMNIGCFMPQGVLMNSMSNFMSTTANTDLTGGISVHSNVMATSNNQINKPMFNIPRIPQNHDDYGMNYEEIMQAKHHKQQHRTQQNFGSNFPPQKDNVDSVNNTPDKMSSKLAAATNTQPSSNQPNTRSGIAQTSSNAMSNSQSAAGPGDPRRMQHHPHQGMPATAYHHHPQQQQQQHHHFNPTAVTHPTNPNHPQFNPNIYTAASGHHHHHHPQHPQHHAGTSGAPTSHNPYAAAAAAMVNQAGAHASPHNGIAGPPPPSASTIHAAQQIHLMQQQMHNFSQSYQFPNLFQDHHLMSTMVSNSNNRNNLATTAANVMSQQNHHNSNNSNSKNATGGNGIPGGIGSQGNSSSGMQPSISNNSSQTSNPPRSNRNNSLWHQTN